MVDYQAVQLAEEMVALMVEHLVEKKVEPLALSQGAGKAGAMVEQLDKMTVVRRVYCLAGRMDLNMADPKVGQLAELLETLYVEKMVDYQDVLLAVEMASYKVVRMDAEKMAARQVESKEKRLVVPLVVGMVDMQELTLDCLMAVLMGSIMVVEMVENQVVYQVYLLVAQMAQTWGYVTVVKSVATTVYQLVVKKAAQLALSKGVATVDKMVAYLDGAMAVQMVVKKVVLSD